MDESILDFEVREHWQQRAAEALEGPDAEYDPHNRQHKAAVLLMAADLVPFEATYAVDQLAEVTGFSRNFVDAVLRRYRNGEVPPSAFELFELPGPDFEVIRDVQVGLGLAYRHVLSKRLVEYDFTDTARVNIARLKRIHESQKNPKGPRDVARVDPAPAFEGTIRRKRGANAFGIGVGSTLIAEPEGKMRWRVGARLRFELAGMTLWLRVESKLAKPRRYEVRLLGATTDIGVPEELLANLRVLLRGGHSVHSFVPPERTVFEITETEAVH